MTPLGRLLLLLTCTCATRGTEHQQRIVSPDRRVQVEFLLRDGAPCYAVSYENKSLIRQSRLGFHFANEPSMIGDFRVAAAESRSLDETWRPVWGTASEIRNNCNELTVTLQESSGLEREMRLVFRAYDDGAAFRYVLPTQPNMKRCEIISEETRFNFAGDFDAWWIPADYDSYEKLYSHTPLSAVTAANTPITMKTSGGLYLSVHEANLTDYSGMTLKALKGEPSSFECDLAPWPDGVKVRRAAPLETPWRTIQIAPDAGGLIESHLIANLNEPCRIEVTSWIKPMKYVGIWWGMHIKKHTWHAGPRHGATTENAKRYIDFAAAHNIPGLLVEGWNKGWSTWGSGETRMDFCTPYPDFDLREVVRYGKEKGVSLIGHHETGGNVPDYERQMEDAFALYEELGVPAVKTGYAGAIVPKGRHHHGQYMVNHYRRVVETAARHRIMIDAHEPIKSTGIERTWPNMMTREGGRGMEYNAWSEGNPPEHTTVLPFTRLLAGPMDYTPGVFDLRFDHAREHRVHTTLAKQLALYVVLYSPLQMACDLVENYEGQPAFEFIEKVPVTWDETRVLNGEIGDYVTIARRSGAEWYIGGVTDENHRLLEIPLSFLSLEQKYVAQVFSDAIDTDWEHAPEKIQISRCSVDSQDVLRAALAKGGGLAARLAPAAENEAATPASLAEFTAETDAKMKAFSLGRPYGQALGIDHWGRGKPVELKHLYSDKYTGGGPDALTDGVRGGPEHQRAWQGFEQVDLHAVIDLGESIAVDCIRAGFLRKTSSWIFLPTRVEFAISEDGLEYQTVATFFDEPLEEDLGYEIKDFAADNLSEKAGGARARYVRVQAANVGACPQWHYAAGGRAWLFVDEIAINPPGDAYSGESRGKYFEKKQYDGAVLPDYETFKQAVPTPILSGRPGWIEMYWKCWEIAFDHLRRPVPESGFVSNYLDEAFCDNIFQWDTIFMVMFARYGQHAFPAIQSLDNFYCKQHANGYICREISETTGEDFVFAGRRHTVNPPLFSWAEVESYKLTGDKSRFAMAAPVLEKYAEWLETGRTKPGARHKLYWNTGLGSGMDNTPRGGSGWTDMSCQMVIQYDNLAEMFDQLDEPDKAARFRGRAAEISRCINRWMWSEEDGLYYDVDDEGGHIKWKTAACFWPLLAGVADSKQAARLVEHLRDPASFWRQTVFPTLAADQEGYDPDGGYWKGGVWAPTNLAIIKGLESRGYEEFAAEASERYLAAIHAVFKKTGTLWENYAPERYEPGEPSRKDFVGWTGCGPIALLIENVLGLRCNAAENRLTWRVRRTDRHGIQNLRFGGTIVSVVCAARPSAENPAAITVETNNSFELHVILNGKETRRALERGRHEVIIGDTASKEESPD